MFRFWASDDTLTQEGTGVGQTTRPVREKSSVKIGSHRGWRYVFFYHITHSARFRRVLFPWLYCMLWQQISPRETTSEFVCWLRFGLGKEGEGAQGEGGVYSLATCLISDMPCMVVVTMS